MICNPKGRAWWVQLGIWLQVLVLLREPYLLDRLKKKLVQNSPIAFSLLSLHPGRSFHFGTTHSLLTDICMSLGLLLSSFELACSDRTPSFTANQSFTKRSSNLVKTLLGKWPNLQKLNTTRLPPSATSLALCLASWQCLLFPWRSILLCGKVSLFYGRCCCYSPLNCLLS